MPRAFTEEERNRIRSSLIDAGRTCFLKYGIRKTTINDLVKLSGIAKGSFYQFFTSKENLYLELFTLEIPAMIKRLHDASFGSTENPRDALILLMKGIAHEIETNALAGIILDDPSEVEHFMSSHEFESLSEQIRVAYAPMVESIKAAQAAGEIVSVDPDQIVYCLGIVKYLAVFREKIGAPMYESMISFVPEVIADGLTRCQSPRSESSPHNGEEERR